MRKQAPFFHYFTQTPAWISARLLRSPERRTQGAEEVEGEAESQQSLQAAAPQSSRERQTPSWQKELKSRNLEKDTTMGFHRVQSTQATHICLLTVLLVCGELKTHLYSNMFKIRTARGHNRIHLLKHECHLYSHFCLFSVVNKVSPPTFHPCNVYCNIKCFFSPSSLVWWTRICWVELFRIFFFLSVVFSQTNMFLWSLLSQSSDRRQKTVLTARGSVCCRLCNCCWWKQCSCSAVL